MVTEINKLNEIYNILKKDNRYISEDGSLLKNKIYESGMKMDGNLLKLLYSDALTRELFFVNIDGINVFDKIQFGWTINSHDFLPDSYTQFSNNIILADERGNSISKVSGSDVVLLFPYKECLLEAGQTKEDQARQEIFYNQILAKRDIDRLLEPKVFTNAKKYTESGDEENITSITENDSLIIKGNNLLVISSLLKRYNSRIKCIYIDPPYNPKSHANTFSYNNKFNHSSWLTFMKNRLEIAKQLLSQDGVLIVAIDKNEQPYLQILVNEIFHDYDTDCITIMHNPRGAQGTNFSYTHEFAIFVTPKGLKTICNKTLENNEVDWRNLRDNGGESLRTDAKNCFYPIIIEDNKIVGFGDVLYDINIHPRQQTVKIDNKYYVYPIDVKDIERKWRYARQSVESIQHLLKVKQTKRGYEVEIGKNFGTYKTVWIDKKYDANEYGTKILTSLIGGNPFSYPKSLYTVIDCLLAVVKDDEEAIILDFFAGSGTTGHAVSEINKLYGGNRKFILVEQMDYIESVTVKRNLEIIKKLKNHGSFIYCELKELAQECLDKIDSCDENQLIDLYEELKDNQFISYRVEINKLEENKDGFRSLSSDEMRHFLQEVIDKNMLYVNYCDINDEEYNISQNDKLFNNSFYKRGEEYNGC